MSILLGFESGKTKFLKHAFTCLNAQYRTEETERSNFSITINRQGQLITFIRSKPFLRVLFLNCGQSP